MLESYLRTALSASLAVYMTGNHDWKAIAIAGASAVLGPLLRYVDPNDDAFGRTRNPNSEK